MKKFLSNIFCFIFLYTTQILPQQFLTGSPEWLIDKFFRAEKFSEKANCFTGEMLNDTNKITIGEVLEGNGEVLFHQIKSENEECAFSVEINLDNQIIDMYAYLVKSGNEWEMSAVRRFLLPSFVYSVYDSLSSLENFTSQDSAFYLTLDLFLMNDGELKSYVSNHLEELNNLVWHFNQKENAMVDKLLSELGCSAVFLDTNFPGCIFIQISSFEKMESGFIFTSGSFKLPDISYKDFVYLEEVTDGWFVYRIM